MNNEFINLFAPFLILGAWLLFAAKGHKPLLVFAGLYFASFAGFSSNFSFVYREIHQLIQFFLIILFIYPTIHRGVFNRINYVLVTFLAFIGISLFFAPFDNDAKAQFINYLAAVGVVNYLFFALRTTHDLDTLLSFLATLTVILAFIGCVEIAINPGTRIEATFSNPNYLGLFLGIGFCAIAPRLSGLKKNIAIVLILFAIIASGSRSAVAFPLFYYLCQIYRLRRFDKQIISMLILISVIVITLNTGTTRFSAIKQIDSGDAERLAYASIALRMANSNPLTGIGWGRFVGEFRNYSTTAENYSISTRLLDVSNQDRRVSHNDFLRILAELGWIAFASSIAFTIYGVLIVFRNIIMKSKDIPPMFFGLIFFSLGHNNMNNALFWFIYLLPFFVIRFFYKDENASASNLLES